MFISSNVKKCPYENSFFNRKTIMIMKLVFVFQVNIKKQKHETKQNIKRTRTKAETLTSIIFIKYYFILFSLRQKSSMHRQLICICMLSGYVYVSVLHLSCMHLMVGSETISCALYYSLNDLRNMNYNSISAVTLQNINWIIYK